MESIDEAVATANLVTVTLTHGQEGEIYIFGVSINEPPGPHGTTVPSIPRRRGGPPPGRVPFGAHRAKDTEEIV